MFIGIAINLTGRLLSSTSPASLFANGEPGVWYDPSDLTTLFQDSAGTTPVTTPGQTVGKMLDKSGRGNHATQATSTQRPTYGINPIVGTRNLLTYTEQFDNAAWLKTAATVTANATAAPDNTTTADALFETTDTSSHFVEQRLSWAAGTYTVSVRVKPNGRTWCWINIYDGTDSQGRYFNLSGAGSVGSEFAAGRATTATIAAISNGFYLLTVTRALSASGLLSNIAVGTATADGVNTFAGNASLGIYVWGAQLEVSATATAYQKVVSQYEVTQAGVQSVSYLAFDGVDDSMVTGTITPAIDKLQVFSGLRKLSDATAGVVAELSVSRGANAGSFTLFAPQGGSTAYYLASRGTFDPQFATSNGPYPAPTTNVVGGVSDISGPFRSTRVNGLAVTSTDSLGTGNFLAYPLYIGRRGGASLPFNGRIYSLIVRFGANLTDGQITATETWVNGETGAY